MVKQIARQLAAAQRILIATHVYPDGDALGSQLALGDMLGGLGKDVVLYAERPASHLYDFLPGCQALVDRIADHDSYDCAVALDCGDAQRLGGMMPELLAISPFLVIDHHSGHKEFGTHRWVDETRSSTGEMVYELGLELGAPLSQDAAFCLYAAIVSDSGSFKYSSTTAETLRIAAALVAHGVQPAEVAGRLYDNYTVSRLELLREVLATLELVGDGQIAFIHVSRAMLEATGAAEEDTENFINYPRSLAQVKIAVFMKEGRDGRISVSLRSKGRDHDVARVARLFGGGGHRNAAGFKLEAVAVTALRQQLEEGLLSLLQP